MPVHFEKWSCHFRYDIIAKAIESRNMCFFAKVNRKVAYMAILRVGCHPDFDAIFLLVLWACIA